MKPVIFALAPGNVLLLMLSSCDQTRGGRAGDGPSNGSATVAKYYGGPKPEGVSGPNYAVTTTFYIPQAAISDMYEIEAAELALVRAHAPEVKAFAHMMIKDHRKSSKALRRFIADHPVNVAAPKNIDPRRSAMLANLQGVGPAEFDAVYAGQQAAAHDEAFNRHSSYARRGDNPALKQLARKSVSMVAHHREQAKALDRAIGPQSGSTPSTGT